MNVKRLFLVLFAGIIFVPSHSYAQTIDNISGLGLGSFDFDTAYNATIRLATNGDLGIVGSGIVSNGGEVVGHIRITLPDTGLVDVKCSSTAILAGSGATDLTISNIEIAVNMGTTFGSANACNGVGGGDGVAVTVDMDALPDPNIYIGGEVVINSAITLPSDRAYSTGGAGTPITFSVVVQ
ncbi:MAG: hypothetical protein ACRBDI_09865 [Alphaproteobacteria bacterium]